MICLGDSGRRIYALARAAATPARISGAKYFVANSMPTPCRWRGGVTPPGGVVLLSPAAPSYGAYRDYIERGRDFAEQAGLLAPASDGSHSDAE